MSNKKKSQPIPFAELDVVRKSIAWHIAQITDLYRSLEPHKTPRGMIAGVSKDQTIVNLIFKGNLEDTYKVKKFLEGLELHGKL